MRVKRWDQAVEIAVNARPDSGCIKWPGSHSPQPTGAPRPTVWDSVNKRVRLVYRVTYEVVHGPIPDGFDLDHYKCNQGWCINPYHVEPVTVQENNKRFGATITHCPKGHEYTPENTFKASSKGQGRKCKQCNREQNAAKYVHKGRYKPEHCPQGHEYNEENTYRYGNSRACKTCRKLRSKKWYTSTKS